MVMERLLKKPMGMTAQKWKKILSMAGRFGGFYS
jgi:hypothetical protein